MRHAKLLLVSIVWSLSGGIPAALAGDSPAAGPACPDVVRVSRPPMARIFAAVFESVVEELAESVGRRVEVSTSSSWKNGLQRLGESQFDLTILSPPLAMESLRDADIRLLATSSGWPIVAVARAKEGPASLDALEHERVAVVPGSAGEQHARAYLSRRERYGPESDRWIEAAGATSILLSVLAGEVEVGIVPGMSLGWLAAPLAAELHEIGRVGSSPGLVFAVGRCVSAKERDTMASLLGREPPTAAVAGFLEKLLIEKLLETDREHYPGHLEPPQKAPDRD